MGNTKKAALAAILSIGIAVFAYGETFLALEGGFYRLSDEFTDEDYGRTMYGSTAHFSFTYFPESFPLGFFTRIASGTLSSGIEWTGDNEMSALDIMSISDFRITLAPAFQVQLAPRVRIPLVIGPVFSFYSEETYGSWDSEGGSSGAYYEALNLGLMADAALVVNIVKLLYLKNGITVEWDFLRAEKGEMRMDYRSFRSTRYLNVPYRSLGASFYLGIGLMF